MTRFDRLEKEPSTRSVRFAIESQKAAVHRNVLVMYGLSDILKTQEANHGNSRSRQPG